MMGRHLLRTYLTIAMLGVATGVSAAEGGSAIFAQVGEATISQEQFDLAYERERRERFYHGAPPAGTEADFRRGVVDALVARVLLLEEARRRGVRANNDAVHKALDKALQRHADTAAFQDDRDALLARWYQRYADDSMLAQLEAQVRSVEAPKESELIAYYREYPDKFIEPAQKRISLILFGVDPSAGAQAWEAARVDAAGVVEQLRQGHVDFRDVARQRSTDTATAAAGGDMGYLHNGMLNTQAEEALRVMQPGDVSDPVTVLEGIAVFRLDERRQAVLNDYDTVRDRVAALWQRDRGDEAWNALQRRLRAATPVVLMP